MKKVKAKIVIPLGIVIGALLYTVVVILTSNLVFDTLHWFAIGFVIVNVLLFYLYDRLAAIFIGLMLLAGSFNLLAFTPTITSYDLGFSISNPVLGNIGMKSLLLQPFSMMVLALHLSLNWKSLKNQFAQEKS